MIGSLIGGFLLSCCLYLLASGLSFTGVTIASAAADEALRVQTLHNRAETDFGSSQVDIAGECLVSERYPEEVRRWCGWITEYAMQNGLAPDLVAAVILQESGGQPLAYSHSGAVGLMQVMPRDGLASSFMCKNGPCFSDRPTIQELEKPEFNISYGVGLLSRLVSYHGSLRDGLKSYGPKDVGYYYADIVLGIYQNYGQ
jgi:soluble lytic murein transglycosylase-like protein